MILLIPRFRLVPRILHIPSLLSYPLPFLALLSSLLVLVELLSADCSPRFALRALRFISYPTTPRCDPTVRPHSTRSPRAEIINTGQVLQRFGRYPGRNAALGRESTPGEIEYLAGGGGWGA
jgi:hypothetical protein